eukprot:IDg12455t1
MDPQSSRLYCYAGCVEAIKVLCTLAAVFLLLGLSFMVMFFCARAIYRATQRSGERLSV